MQKYIYRTLIYQISTKITPLVLNPRENLTECIRIQLNNWLDYKRSSTFAGVPIVQIICINKPLSTTSFTTPKCLVDDFSETKICYRKKMITQNLRS